MKKRVIISLLLLLIALCLSVTSYVLLQNCIGKLGQTLQNAVYTNLPAEESCRQIEACAAETLPKLRIFAIHGTPEELSNQLCRLPVEQDDPVRYRDTCLLCLQLLEDFTDGQKLSLENVL